MIILASTSLARQRLLQASGIAFAAHRPSVDEQAFKHQHPGMPGAELANALAQAKAESLRPAFPAALIIGCDQVLSCDTRIFDKPRSPAEALEHLSFLQGKTHTLHTALYCLGGPAGPYQVISEPNLTMRKLQKPYLQDYLEKTGPGIFSCVGCYQIEGLGVQLFDAIDGDIFSIQGLPLLPLLAHLRTSGLVTS